MTFQCGSNMVLTIYDKYGQVKAEVAANDSSTQQKEVQGDNVLTLSFTYYEHVALDVNDYTDFMGERYWLTEKYQPAQKSEGEWGVRPEAVWHREPDKALPGAGDHGRGCRAGLYLDRYPA